MHPSVGLSMQRHAPKSGIELAGRFIPAGYRIGVNSAVAHFDKGAFGEDADGYRPERWPVGTEEWKAMDRSMLIGAGTRTCIGKNVRSCFLENLVITANICRSRWLSCTRLCRRFFDNLISR
jgi:cytochrome P450